MSEPTETPIMYRWRWWYKGRCPAGNTFSFEGRVVAKDNYEAADKIEKMMRARHPHFKWMQGREVEGNGVLFGPTVQRLKKPINPTP